MKTLIFFVISAFFLFGCKEKEEVHIIPQNPIDTVKRTVIDSFAGNYNCYYMYTSILNVSEPAPNAGTHYDTSESGYCQVIIKRYAADSFTIYGLTDAIYKRVFYLNNYNYAGELFPKSGINIKYFPKQDSLSILTSTFQGGGPSGSMTYNSFWMGRKQR